jgi:phenylacetate-CoA ligase
MKHTPEIEFQSTKVMKAFQEDKLKELLSYLSQHSLFYQSHFSKHQVDVTAIQQLDQLRLIPPTTKDDLQQFNWDFLCVPRTQVVEYTSTSGTLGKPVTIALTENDLQRLAYNESLSFSCADGTSSDLYQLMLTLDRQFMAGIAYYEGIRKLGAGLVRVGPGLPAMQWETIERLQPSVLVAVPSFIVKLIEFAQQKGINPNRSSVKRIICIGESLRTNDFELNILGKKIRDAWNVQLYSTYASTEMQTAFTECSHGKGGHQHPELIIVELLDDHNLPVKEGDPGEVTITTLGVEGMPLLRYKTGDIAVAHTATCGCGRTSLRLGPVLGRKQQMIKLKGTTIYPPGVFEILNQVEMIKDYVVEVFTGAIQTDELRLYLRVEAPLVDKVLDIVRSEFQSRLRVVPEIVMLSATEMDQLQQQGQNRKLNRFRDNRQ